jgi:hypothetical protein
MKVLLEIGAQQLLHVAQVLLKHFACDQSRGLRNAPWKAVSIKDFLLQLGEQRIPLFSQGSHERLLLGHELLLQVFGLNHGDGLTDGIELENPSPGLRAV